MPANILDLPAYAVTHFDKTEHDYHIKAETKAAPTHCPHCRSSNIVGFGRREQLVKDLPSLGRRVGIYINTRRMKCIPCAKTFSESLPDVDEKRAMTKRLLAMIELPSNAEFSGERSEKAANSSAYFDKQGES